MYAVTTEHYTVAMDIESHDDAVEIAQRHADNYGVPCEITEYRDADSDAWMAEPACDVIVPAIVRAMR